MHKQIAKTVKTDGVNRHRNIFHQTVRVAPCLLTISC